MYASMKIKFVLTFTNNDMTLAEIYAITVCILNFSSQMCQIKVGVVQANTPENVDV